MKRILGSIRRADEAYGMLGDGDRVLVAVSGGKDSMLLMEGLRRYSGFSKARFSVQAALVDIGLFPIDTSAVEAYAAGLGVEFTVIRTQIGEIVFNVKKDPNPCALCATLRRGALNSFALERGCNKVALGHNREDVLETFLMSLLYEGRVNTFGPVTYLTRTGLTLIRPFVMLPEHSIKSVVREREIPLLPPQCPAAGHTKREEMKQLLGALSQYAPDAREKLIFAIASTDTYGLWDRLRRKPEE